MTHRERAEVAVIGGGIAGASAACALADRGWDVILLERGQLACGATGASAGMFWSPGPANAPTMQGALGAGSAAILRRHLAGGAGLSESGGLQVARSVAEAKHLADVARDLADAGHEIGFLSPEESRAREPGLALDIEAALYYPEAGAVDPVLAVQALVTAAQRDGARVRCGFHVEHIEPAGGVIRCISPQREAVECDRLVVAAGPGSASIGDALGATIPVVPVLGQMWATEPAPPTLHHVLCGAESTLHWSRSGMQPPLTHEGGRRVTRHFYSRQAADGAMLVGGDRRIAASPSPDPESMAEGRAHATALLPSLAAPSHARTWTGWMAYSTTGGPLIAPVAGAPGVFALTGFFSSGLETAPMAAELLADWMTQGMCPTLLTSATPARAADGRLDMDEASE